MTNRQIELALNRGRLQERIASQRILLAEQVAPLVSVLVTTDQAVAAGRSGLDYIKQHPGQLGAALAVLAALRPKRVWRWGKRAFVAWGVWNKVRGRLAAAGLIAGRNAP